MTWSVGMCNGRGAEAIILADICVAWGFPNGPTFDCLQKVHPVAASFVMSFAGSVTLGFRMIAYVRTRLASELAKDPSYTVRDAVLWLPRAHRYVWSRGNGDERRNGLSTLIAGPDVPALSALGRAKFPRVNIYRCSRVAGRWAAESALNPQIEIRGSTLLSELARRDQTLSIGSGAWKFDPIFQGVRGSLGGFPSSAERAEFIRSHGELAVRSWINQGISPELSTAIIKPDEPAAISAPKVTWEHDKRSLPRLCEDAAQFAAFCGAKGLRAAAALA